jgi:hypothetical protein
MTGPRAGFFLPGVILFLPLAHVKSSGKLFLADTHRIIRAVKESVMKKIISVVMLVALMVASTLAFVQSASAEEMKMVGTISKLEMSADKKSATVVLKDTKSAEEVTIVVNDELTLDKFMDKRIVEGDEIRCKYEKVNGKNISKIFKKTAGC